MASLATINDLGKKPPVAVAASIASEDSLVLNLVIDDPEVSTELRRRAEGHARNTFAVSALRIGILALRQAQGNVDAEVVRNEGQRLIAELSRELALGVQQIDSKIAGSLKLYFDPQSGHFTERVERLVRKDGDLETMLRQQIGDGESSELARALARRIGETSPLMRRLDPQDAESISRSIETSVKDVLDSRAESNSRRVFARQRGWRSDSGGCSVGSDQRQIQGRHRKADQGCHPRILA
jgi:hypothetical protein